MNKKIKLVPKSEMNPEMQELKKNLACIIEGVVVIAEIRKASYDAHLGQGFTEEQALELCKTLTL